MPNKFLIAIAVVIVAMVALIAIPRIASPPTEHQQQLRIEYVRQNLTTIEDGRLAASSADDTVINNDLSATYHNLVGTQDEKKFEITSQEMDNLKGLILTTGFMGLPGENYPEKANSTNLTKYTLKLESGGNSKTIMWTDEKSSEVFVPGLIRNIGAQLDIIIDDHL